MSRLPSAGKVREDIGDTVGRIELSSEVVRHILIWAPGSAAGGNALTGHLTFGDNFNPQNPAGRNRPYSLHVIPSSLTEDLDGVTGTKARLRSQARLPGTA